MRVNISQKVAIHNLFLFLTLKSKIFIIPFEFFSAVQVSKYKMYFLLHTVPAQT